MLTRYVLDGNIIEELPEGWNDRSTTVANDRTLKGRLVTEDATLTWFADGYQYIKTIFDNNIVGEIEIKVQTDALHNGTWVTDYTGILKMPGCEFNIAPNFVKTKIEDDGFYSRINNNKSIKTTVNNSRSKNDAEITVASPLLLNCFDPVDGTFGYSQRTSYSIDECFRYMIAFISDGEVGYVSETFFEDLAAPGEYAKFVIIRGIELRLGNTNTDVFLELDFKTLYTEVDKKFNIGFRMERINGVPTMRIEKESWFNKNSSYTRFNNLRDIKRTVDAEYLYSAVGGGSSILELIGEFPEKVKLKGFNDEQFYVIGKSNIDRVLDLKSDWIISSNIIEDVVVNGSDSYDDDVFMIEINNFTGLFALATNWLAVAPPYYYNEHLTNEHVIDRWLDGIPAIVASQLGAGGDNRFKAIRTIPATGIVMAASGSPHLISTEPVQFDNDYTPPNAFDPTNRYGNGTAQGSPVPAADSRYTAIAAGQYNFSLVYNIKISVLPSFMSFKITLKYKVYDVTNAPVAEYTLETSYDRNSMLPYFPFSSRPLLPDRTITFNRSIPLSTDDYVVIERIYTSLVTDPTNPGAPAIEVYDMPNSTFACIYSSADTGGEYTTTQIINQRYMKYAAKDVPVTEEQVAAIIEDTAQPVWMNVDGNNNYKGWIDKIKFNRSEGTADIEIRGRRIDEPINP